MLTLFLYNYVFYGQTKSYSVKNPPYLYVHNTIEIIRTFKSLNF